MLKNNVPVRVLATALAMTCIAPSANAQRVPRNTAPVLVAPNPGLASIPVPEKRPAPDKILSIQSHITAYAFSPAMIITLLPECEIVDTGPHSNIIRYRTGQVRFKMMGSAPAGTTVFIAGSTGGGQVPFANGTYTSAAGMDNSFVIGIIDVNFNPVAATLDLDGAQPVPQAGSAGFYRWDWDSAPSLNECPVGRV